MALRTKTTKKKTTTTKKKPIARKKTTQSKSKKKTLINASPETSFWAVNGSVLKNLEELSASLKTDFSDDDFKYHTSEDNHFAEWIEKVLNEPKVAKAIKRSKTRNGAVKILAIELKEYK